MWKSFPAILTISGILTVATASDMNMESPDLKSIQYDQQALIILNDGEEFYASGLALSQNTLTVDKWRVSTNDMWKEVSRSISTDRIAGIQFQSYRNDHSRHGMYFWRQGWVWGSVMILMMAAMITGGMI